MPYLLGLDIGSSTTKVGLFTLLGKPVYIATRSYEICEPRPGFKEQDPEVWWRAVVDGICEVTKRFNARDVLAIGITGHIVSHVFIDEAGEPIEPSISFQDQRSVLEMKDVYEVFTREELTTHLGIDLPPAPTWPLPRLVWMRKHCPRTLESARCMLQAKDYINFRLTGELSSDRSSNRGILNLVTGRPATAVLSRLGIRDDLLPRIQEPAEVMGNISSECSRLTGLVPGIPVTTGWNDLNASVLGSGTVNEGEAFNITGSSEHLGLVMAIESRSPELICAPFLPGKFILYGVTSSGGGSLDWYRKTFGHEYWDLLRLAEMAPVGSESLFFLPYLEGERAPIWDPNASGAFVGIRAFHNEGHFVRAVLEGVAYGLLEILKPLEAISKKHVGPILVSGGGARIDLWNVIKANVWGRPLSVPENVHSAVLGAAMLAGVAINQYPTCEAASNSMRRPAGTINPDEGCSSQYREFYVRFRGLYPALRNWFSPVSGFQNRKGN